jgi:Tol biopolymer transport system component
VVLVALLGLLIVAAMAILVGSRERTPAPLGLARNGLVAYAQGRDVVVVDPATGSSATLTTFRGPVGRLAWSPDGSRLAVAASVEGGEVLYLVEASGGAVREVIEEAVQSVGGLGWSPDGTRLAFSDGDVWIVPASGGGGALEIGFRAEHPIWRPPAGDELLFGNGDGAGLFLVRPDGASLRPLTFRDGTIVDDDLASWTPDGERIVTMRQEAGVGEELYRLHVLTVGSDGRVVVDRPVGPVVLPLVGLPISPDGSRVMFATGGPDGEGWRLGVAGLDDGAWVLAAGPTFTSQERIASWAPDGQQIAVNAGEEHGIWLLDADGGPARQGSWTDRSGEPPAWQRRP